MTDARRPRHRRPRLDAEEADRLRAEIARLQGPPISVQLTQRTRELREAVFTVDEVAQDADPATPEMADAPEAPDAPGGAPTGQAALPVPGPDAAERWEGLRRIPIDTRLLDRNLVITAARTDPAHASFDVMRTRLVQALAEKGWKRVAITSPTKGCGKTFTATRTSPSRCRATKTSRTVLMDMDLRHPERRPRASASKRRGLHRRRPARRRCRFTDHLRRPGENALNIGRSGWPSASTTGPKILSRPSCSSSASTARRRCATSRHDELDPEVILLYDLPPALAYDDVIAFRPQFDCVLLVIGGGITSAKEVREVHRRLGEDMPVVGVILNMSEDDEDNTY